MKQVSLALCLLIAILFIGGCGPASQITSSWVKPSVTTTGISRIMIVALVGDANRQLRQQMETHLAEDLAQLGYNALSSYAEYGPQMFDIANEQAAVQQMKDKNVDAVLTVVMLDKNEEQHYVPGRVSYTPYATYYNRFWGYYTTLYDRVYVPGYYTANTEYFWESNLYDLNSGDLIYSVQTKSFNPGSSSDLAHEYGELIVKDMVDKAILRRRN